MSNAVMAEQLREWASSLPPARKDTTATPSRVEAITRLKGVARDLARDLDGEEVCHECGMTLGGNHAGPCGKRAVDCPEVVADDCKGEDEAMQLTQEQLDVITQAAHDHVDGWDLGTVCHHSADKLAEWWQSEEGRDDYHIHCDEEPED